MNLKNEIIAATDFNQLYFDMKFESLAECLLKANALYFERIRAKREGIVDITKHPAILAELNQLLTDQNYRETYQHLNTTINELRDLASPIFTNMKKATEADFKKALTLMNAIRSFTKKLGDNLQEDKLKQQISQCTLNYEVVRNSYDPHNQKGTQPLKVEHQKKSLITIGQRGNKENIYNLTNKNNKSPHS